MSRKPDTTLSETGGSYHLWISYGLLVGIKNSVYHSSRPVRYLGAIFLSNSERSAVVNKVIVVVDVIIMTLSTKGYSHW